MAQQADITAAILVIGDEILSGRTKDANSGYIADYLAQIGVDLREVRVIGDVEPEIVAAVNALRARYDYVFTTGGIGPTHDDITADAIARAFGVGISEDPRAIALLLEKIKPEDLNEARRRMARVPHGAELVENDISKAPGFWIGNVIVMAGVPAIMRSMLDRVAPKLARGIKVLARAILAENIPEGAYAAGLSEVARAYPELSIGSYPSFRDGGFRNEIVVRGKDADKVGAAAAEIEALLVVLREGEAGRQRPLMKSR
ncbi:competence/damage-inducible protein A [Methylocella silvestris]|uniref:Competence/damage-inducible protein A n=1 Tax=Methylocella silvestris TaxID=199596 RepID=A0A2J7THQ1_METSI|nr:molybdopterin-binding protein [Methylocella silvestris]PNG26304.1 competence/damage-inducible protein A [Methylocella silvestris]